MPCDPQFAAPVPHDSGAFPVPEPVRHATHDRRAILFRAGCAGLSGWSSDLGLDVSLIGVAVDPLRLLGELSEAGFAAAGLVMDEVVSDGRDWADWHLRPFPCAAGLAAGLPGGRPLGGAVGFDLPAGADCDVLALLARRFGALMAPQEASRLWCEPEAIVDRQGRFAMAPAVPRFTRTAGGHVPARGLYRLSGPEDVGHVAAALVLALDSLAGTCVGPVLDLMARGRAEAGLVPDGTA